MVFYIDIKMKGEQYMHKTGEKPGIGTYACFNCGQEVYLNDSTDRLPPCPRCTESLYIKK